MLKHFKKLVAIITVVAIVAVMFYCMNTSAASTVWSPSKGAPTLTDIEDGYTYVRVNASAPAHTNDKYNLEEKAIYIRNFNVPEKQYWACISFSIDPRPSANTSKPSEGFLAFLIKGNDNNTSKFQMFFYDGSKQLELGNIERSDNLYIKFIKTDSGYAMQVNEAVITHEYISVYCGSEYHKDARINAFAANYMSGDIKIMTPDFGVDATAKPVAVYKSDENIYSLNAKEKGRVYSIKNYDFLSENLEIKKIELSEGNSFTTEFYVNTAEDSKADFSLKFEAEGEKYNVYSGYDLLGTIAKSSSIKYSLVHKGGTYKLLVNDAEFELNNALKSQIADSKKLYVGFSVPAEFTADICYSKLIWSQFAGNGAATVTLNNKNINHIELTSGQNVAPDGMYDIYTTGIKLSSVELPDSNSSSKGGLIYFGKTLNKSAPCNASEDAISFLFEKTSDGMAFSFLNSNGEKAYIGTVPFADSYSVSFSLIQKSRTLKVNDKEFKLDKLEGAASKLACEDIVKFVGDDKVNKVYIGVSTTDYLNADVELFEFARPVSPVGVSVYGDGKVTQAIGNDQDGYSAKTKGEGYLVTNLINDHSVYALDTRIKSLGGAVYFALSTTDVSDTNFFVCGDGKKVNRVGFVITPLENNTKAQIAYYGADGVNATETVIDTIDFDWTTKHSYGVRQSDDNNWYLYIDGAEMNKVTSAVLNDFMNKNGDEELFFIFGSKNAIDVSLFKFINHPVAPIKTEKEGWAAYPGKISQLEKEAEGDAYIYPSLKTALYCVRNGTEDITKTSVKIKINSVSAINSKKFIYFALSATDMSDKSFSPSGKVDKVKRVTFRMNPDFDEKTLTILAYNDDESGNEQKIAVIKDFDFTVAHTFDIRLCTDNKWYFCVDNIVYKDVKLKLLQKFMEKYSAKQLYYCIGSAGAMQAEALSIVPQEAADVNINVETWYQLSTNRGPMQGNDTDGYYLHKDSMAWAYSGLKYDPTTTALSLKMTDIAGWAYFSVVTCDYNDTNWLPVGTGDKVNRAILLIVPAGDAAQFQYWCADGKSKTPTVVTTYKFDWFDTTHTFDVRQNEEDGNWYFCVDGKLLMNKISSTLNQFMKANAGEDLRYCFGGQGCLGIENVKVVDKPKAIVAGDGDSYLEDGDYEEVDDFGFDLEFDNTNEDILDDFDDFGDEEFDPLDYLQKVKVKKRRLVSAAHGIIFTTFEIAAMIGGGVLVLAAGTVLTVLLIKRKKKKAKK